MVLRDGDVVLEDLVSSDAIVAANKEFVSDTIVGLGWPAGSRRLTFYLRKGGEFRRWQTADVAAPAERMPVEIQLRQMPAQGRAHVSITSQQWDALKHRPILLDWAKLETDPRSFDEIAEELKPQPIVPERLTAFTHIARWKGTDRPVGFGAFILVFKWGDGAALEELGRLLAQASPVEIGVDADGRRITRAAQLLDFDGNPPEGADPKALASLDAVLGRISSVCCHLARQGTPLPNNTLLKVATWAYGRCPGPLQDKMLRALADLFEGRDHPFLQVRGSRTILIHGLGRTVVEPARLGRVLDLLLANWTKGSVPAALASILSRPKAVSAILDEDRTVQAARVAVILLRHYERNQYFGTRSKYALIIVAVLLRCRENRRRAILRSMSNEADELYSVLTKISETIAAGRGRVSQPTIKIALIDKLQLMLAGTGGDSAILEGISQLDDEDVDS